MSTKSMYFTCPTLMALMTVSACEFNRIGKFKDVGNVKQCCLDCTKWTTLTTDTANLQSAEEVLNPVQAVLDKPKRVKFDTGADMLRVRNIGDNRDRYSERMRYGRR